MLSLNCKNVQHVKIYKKVPQLKMSKITNVALVIADLLSKKMWAGIPPLI
jgi:hypothetical protein